MYYGILSEQLIRSPFYCCNHRPLPSSRSGVFVTVSAIITSPTTKTRSSDSRRPTSPRPNRRRRRTKGSNDGGRNNCAVDAVDEEGSGGGGGGRDQLRTYDGQGRRRALTRLPLFPRAQTTIADGRPLVVVPATGSVVPLCSTIDAEASCVVNETTSRGSH